jgi:isopenicillin N synthase-like dioxygenase
LVAKVKVAAETTGLFHLVNHGVPGELMSEMLVSVRRFHEVPPEAKRPYYTRDPGRRRERGGPTPVERSAAADGREWGRRGRRRAPRRGGERRWGARGLAGDGEVESVADAPQGVGIRSSRN